jgi:serine/threonine protein kinase
MGLESRIFDRVADNLASSSSLSNRGRHKSKHLGLTSGLCTPSPSSRDSEMQTTVGEGMQFKEDTFLTSANLCRWIIDFGDIQLGKQIGLGSYGVVFGGKWKGVQVAVKRFIKQKLNERRMLEFRAEMAFLSELHHPNIVLFIGACVKKPNLCIVTEFMKQGSLRDILANNAIKLAWKQKLRMLRSAALGINYLHSLHPVIVHRDIKPSNLLVRTAASASAHC